MQLTYLLAVGSGRRICWKKANYSSLNRELLLLEKYSPRRLVYEDRLPTEVSPQMHADLLRDSDVEALQSGTPRTPRDSANEISTYNSQ